MDGKGSVSNPYARDNEKLIQANRHKNLTDVDLIRM